MGITSKVKWRSGHFRQNRPAMRKGPVVVDSDYPSDLNRTRPNGRSKPHGNLFRQPTPTLVRTNCLDLLRSRFDCKSFSLHAKCNGHAKTQQIFLDFEIISYDHRRERASPCVINFEISQKSKVRCPLGSALSTNPNSVGQFVDKPAASVIRS